MPDDFDPRTSPPPGWDVAEVRQNGAIFKFETTGCELLVLQIKGPGKAQGESAESYLLRYFKGGDRNSYVDLATVDTKSEMREITREVMDEIRTNQSFPDENKSSFMS